MSKIPNSIESSSSDSESETEESMSVANSSYREAFLKRLKANVSEKVTEECPADFFFVDVATGNGDVGAAAQFTTAEETEKEEKRPLIDLTVKNKNEVEKILAKAVLQPDYDRRAVAEVSAKSYTQQKKQRKLDREKTAGKSWAEMPATELTDERCRDLELLRMRGAIDPRAHYRKMDRDAFPKYFEVGRVVENKADYYSSRLTKKQRKRTMVEELMDDVEAVAKAKRKYTEIMTHKTAAKRRGVSFRPSASSKRTKYKNKAKSH